MAIDIVARSLAVSVKQIAVVANSAITPGTHTKITYDSKGLVTKGEDLATTDIPNLPASKITSGTFADDRIASASTWNNKQASLTTTQLNAVNSGITSGKVSTYDGYKSQINAKYTKPTTGIPKTDLDSSVQTSLGKADSALQSHQQITTGSANGTISVGGTDVAVKGLGSLAYKDSLKKSDVGLGNVDNTSDAEKPISTATQAALDEKQASLTTTQLNAVNSGITSGKVSTYDGYKSQINAKYTKPTGGIPKTDLDSAVQTSLGKADSALQSHQTIKTGSANGTISVGGTDVAVKGLGTAAYKADTYFATAAGTNIFTGTNHFKGGNTYFQTASGGPNDPIMTIGANSVYCQSTGSEPGTYYKDSQITHKNFTLSLPSKSGTVALTSDIPSTSSFVTIADAQTISGNKTFTGTNKFQGGTTSFTEARPTPGSSVTTVDADGVLCKTDSGTGTYYKDNEIQHQAFRLTLPYKSGTLATTSDFPIKTATLSGTTLSITLS